MQINFNNSKIIAGLSERSDGSMVWRNRLPVDEKIKQNRDKYFTEIGIDPNRVIAVGIKHGMNVTVVGEKDAGSYILDSDGLITKDKNLFLSVTVADCLPVYFYDSANEVIGISHAGWKGLVKGVLENTVKKLQENFNSKPENLEVIIGPHILPCHYEIGEEVAENFSKQNIITRDGKIFADLSGEAKLRLESVGVNNITVDETCTYCNADKLYSARHDRLEQVDGMVAYIGLSL
ncbi:MAG: peptidoglycan editing factor PgeF [Candidatus Buchananbacteria bacterium]